MPARWWAPRRHRIGCVCRFGTGAADYARVPERCDRYADADIGFVDATVLAVVERLNEPKLATLDRRRFGLLPPRHRTRSISFPPDTGWAWRARD
jgi:hypothetical protein